MPTYTLETPRGKRLTIESDSPEEATRLADTWDLEDHAVKEATRLGVNPQTALRQMRQESGSRANAVSSKGARGPMQLMPPTAKGLGVDPDDPYQNITGGLTYYKQQLDRFGGDERKALAAYNAGPEAVARAGGVPNYPETQRYVRAIAGAPGAAPAPPGPGPLPMPRQAAPAAAKAPPRKPSEVLGFKTELMRVAERVAPYSPLALIPGYREALAEGKPRLDASLARQAQAREPGKMGAFGADLLAGGVAGGPFNPLVSGALSGLALGHSKDLKGAAGDLALGGVTGRLTAAGGDAVQLAARKLLSKPASVMTLPELQAAKKAAYEAVDASGFTFGKAKVDALVRDFESAVGSRALSKSAKEDAASIIAYTRSLAKGDLSLSELEKLRGDIYDALVKKGGDTANVGGAFRAKIDAMIEGASANDLVRTARDLNARWKKADYINRASNSADLAAERTYGGDYGRKLKDRIAPLVDDLKPQTKFRGATPDETAELNKLARGTKAQNAASAVAGMLDPRRLGGKIVAGMTTTAGGGAALPTGGASLLLPAGQLVLGGGLTEMSSNTARQNLDGLIRLIAAGGSRQALKPVATSASETAEKALVALRPLIVAAGVPALAAARRPPPNPPPQKKRATARTGGK